MEMASHLSTSFCGSLAKGWPPHPPPPEAAPQPEGLSLGQCGFILTPGSSVIPWEPLGTQVPQCKTYTVLFFFF